MKIAGRRIKKGSATMVYSVVKSKVEESQRLHRYMVGKDWYTRSPACIAIDENPGNKIVAMTGSLKPVPLGEQSPDHR